MRLTERDDGLTDLEKRLLKTMAGAIVGVILAWLFLKTI